MPQRRTLGKLLRRGIAFRLSCSEPCRVTVRLTARIGGRDVLLAKAQRTSAPTAACAWSRRSGRERRAASVWHVPRGSGSSITATDAVRNTRTVVRRIDLR